MAFDTYFTNPVCPTPGPEGTGVESRGGADLTDGRKETANSVSGLPLQPTIIGVEGGPPASNVESQIPSMQDRSPVTFHNE